MSETIDLLPEAESDLDVCDGPDSSNPPYCWREFRPTGGAPSIIDALTDGNAGTGIRNADFDSPTYNGPFGLQGVLCEALDVPDDATILGVRVIFTLALGEYSVTPAVGECSIGRNGSSAAKAEPFFVSSDGAPTITSDFTARGPGDKPEGAVWTPGDLGASSSTRLQVIFGTDRPYCIITSCLVEVDVDALAGVDAGVEAARAISSLHLRQYRRLLPILTLTTSLRRGLSARMGDLVRVANEAIPTADGLGAGASPWARWLGAVIRKRIDPSAGTITLTLMGRSHYLVRLWYRALVNLSGIANLEGVARILTGQTWLFTRAGAAWIEDPASGLVIAISGNAPKIDAGGHLIERESANLALNSSAADGIGSVWTESAGVEASTDVVLFDPDVSAQSWLIPTGESIAQTLTDPGALSPSLATLSIDVRNVDGNPGTFDLQRGVDSKFLRASDRTWQAGAQSNPLTDSAEAWARYIVAGFDLGAAPGALTLAIESGAGALWVAHVQLELLPWASSRIVSHASAVTRSADRQVASNDLGARIWPADHGTARLRWRWLFTAADVAGYAFTLYWLDYGADSIRVYYDGTSGELRFVRTRSGVTTTALLAVTPPVRGAAIDAVFRWTGEAEEQGDQAWSARVFADGVKGEAAVAAGAPLESAASTLEICSGSGGWLDGAIEYALISPLVLDDATCERPD